MRRFVAAALLLAAFAIDGRGATLGPDAGAGVRLPGKVIWLDLATEDPASARAFYGAVFGWTFRDAAPSYAIAENGSGKVAGVFRHDSPRPGAVRARWLALISVTDAAQAARAVHERGGEVLVAPRTIAGRGTHAVFRDPDGAVFGVLQGEGGDDPPDTPVELGDLFWLDLFSRDPAAAATFYAQVAGYDVDVGEIAGRERTLLSTNGIARAGIAKLRPEGGAPGWLPYILVDDVAAALARARQAGGRVVLGPRPELLDGNLAVIADREGGVIGIVRWTDEGVASGVPR